MTSKTTTFFALGLMLLLAISIESCQKPKDAESYSTYTDKNLAIISQNFLCGYEKYDLLAGRSNPIKVGEVEVANDAHNLYVEITPTSPDYTSYRLFVGDCNIVRSDSGSAPNIFQYPLQGTFYADSAIVTVSLDTLPNCFCVVALLSQPRGTGDIPAGSLGGNSNALLIDYCEQPCPSCNSNNIFGQGGWGAKPAGNNPGTYLYANFANWFPSGITVGCATGYTIQLTSAQAVTNFLPQGGTPKSLTQNYTNPSNRITVLAGHLVALAINLKSNPSLGAQVISTGAFAGQTVNQLFVAANELLGGCRTGSASQYNDLMDAINSAQSGFVSCN